MVGCVFALCSASSSYNLPSPCSLAALAINSNLYTTCNLRCTLTLVSTRGERNCYPATLLEPLHPDIREPYLEAPPLCLVSPFHPYLCLKLIELTSAPQQSKLYFALKFYIFVPHLDITNRTAKRFMLTPMSVHSNALETEPETQLGLKDMVGACVGIFCSAPLLGVVPTPYGGKSGGK